MKYIIGFIYTDNAERYEDIVELDSLEAERVLKFLLKLEEADEIEREGDGNPFMFPWTPEVVVPNFDTLHDNWRRGSLIRMGKQNGIEL